MKLRPDIDAFLKTLPSDITLVAASKYVDSTTMKEMLLHGISNFGENRVDIFLRKQEELQEYPQITWHFIGHLQRNKAKKVINRIDVLHSLDNIELAKLIQKEREKPLDCFIEVSINLEENKDGVDYRNIDAFLQQVRQYDKVHIIGLMMMAIKYASAEEAYQQFLKLYELRNQLEQKYNLSLPYLSMGMSDDYLPALRAHATHIRLGRKLFVEE